MKMPKQIPCDLCPKIFATWSGLRHHKQTHNGVKKYGCLQCNKSFTRNNHLRPTPSFTVGRNSISAHIATFHATSLPPSKGISGSTLGRNRTTTINAVFHAANLLTSKSISRSTPGKNCSSATNVNIKQHNQATCKRTRRRTLVKRQRDAHRVSIRASQLVN